jgi:hypothetical protein
MTAAFCRRAPVSLKRPVLFALISAAQILLFSQAFSEHLVVIIVLKESNCGIYQRKERKHFCPYSTEDSLHRAGAPLLKHRGPQSQYEVVKAAASELRIKYQILKLG